MFNRIPALPCSQVPRTVDECGALFRAAPAVDAVPASRLPHVSHPSSPARHSHSQGSHPHDSRDDAADRVVAAIAKPKPHATTAAPKAAVSRRPLCNCSQLEVLHYQHRQGEPIEAVHPAHHGHNSSLSEDVMDTGDDDSFGMS